MEKIKQHKYTCEVCGWKGDFSDIKIGYVKRFGTIGVCLKCGNVILENIIRFGHFVITETDRSSILRDDILMYGVISQ